MKSPHINLALKMALFEERTTQRRLAKKLRMTEPHLSDIVRRRVDPTDDEKAAIAKALKRDQGELFSEAVSA